MEFTRRTLIQAVAAVAALAPILEVAPAYAAARTGGSPKILELDNRVTFA